MEIWSPDGSEPVEDDSLLSDVELYKHVTNCADPECDICKEIG